MIDEKVLIERLEGLKGIAFLTLANTSDKKKDIVYDEVIAYLNTSIEMVNLLAEESKDGWIPCSERLPDDFMSMEYLATTKACFYPKINYYCVANHKWYSNRNSTKEIEVIAWMPLPAPYKPKE